MPDAGSDPVSVLANLIAEQAREKDAVRQLLARFGRGELTREQVINELAARFQLDIGASVQALAEYDKDAAQQLGTRLKGRLDAALVEIGRRRSTETPSPQPTSFVDRDDDVLRREYVIVTKLLSHNGAVKTADLISAARAIEPGITDEAVTAHLNRIVPTGGIAKVAKGRYQRGPETQAHREGLIKEIEARRLDLPTVR